jgi:putative oxidoreductase
MKRFIGRYSEYIYAMLRIVVGLLFLFHGTQILLGYPPWPPNVPAAPANAFIMTGGIIQLVTGALVLIGLFASVAAFFASGTMAVAYFMFHQPMGVWPATNLGDAAVLNCFIFLYIASRGSGVWSVDALRGAGPPGV